LFVWYPLSKWSWNICCPILRVIKHCDLTISLLELLLGNFTAPESHLTFPFIINSSYKSFKPPFKELSFVNVLDLVCFIAIVNEIQIILIFIAFEILKSLGVH
jgi:hypothetical protein